MPKNTCQNCFKSFMRQTQYSPSAFMCWYTSLNRVVERKIMQLLETAWALLFQMKVFKQFWADGVSTTCFLINGMTSSVLVCNMSYSVLFPNKSLFPVEPKVFGSTCYTRDIFKMFNHLLPSWVPRHWNVFSLPILDFGRDSGVTQLNLANIWCQPMWYFPRLSHFFMHLPFLLARRRKMIG